MDQTLPNTASGDAAALGDAQEAQWVRQLAARGSSEHDAWERLFKAYSRKILGLGRRFRVPKAMAEDLLQEVMVIVHEKASLFDAVRASPWIMSIAAHKLEDWLRRHDHSRAEHVQDEEQMELLTHRPAAAHAVVPQQVIDDCRRRHWLEFQRARPKAAMALQMCHAEGWTIAELAQYLQTTEGAAKVFLHTERRKAREALEPCEPLDRKGSHTHEPS